MPDKHERAEELYDYALTDVMDHIKQGARLRMLESTRDEVWRYYQPHFHREWSRPNSDPDEVWERYKGRVLFLAKRVGEIATINTAVRWMRGHRISSNLDTEATIEACLWVSWVECGARPVKDGDVETLGCYCTHCPPDRSEEKLESMGLLFNVHDDQMDDVIEALRMIGQARADHK